MTNKEKFLKLVSDEQTDTMERNRKRIANRQMLRESQSIALKVLIRLDELGWKQKKLAEKMGVSPQQVNKIVKGSENLTLETIVKLQNLLELPLLASYTEKKVNKSNIVHFQTELTLPANEFHTQNVHSHKTICYDFSQKYQDTQPYNSVVK